MFGKSTQRQNTGLEIAACVKGYSHFFINRESVSGCEFLSDKSDASLINGGLEWGTSLISAALNPVVE